MTAERTRETRLRRMAKRQDLEIQKSHSRDPRAIGYGCWMIVDPYTNAVVAGVGGTGRPEFTLDDIERWLTEGDR